MASYSPSGNGTQSAATGGSGGSTTPSWAGGNVPDTFDPKTFGTTLYSDASKVYQQGPKVDPTNPFVDYSNATKGLIQQGLDTNTGLQNGLLGQYASGDFLGKGNPFLNDALATTRQNTLNSVGDQFQSFGRFGGGSMVDTASRAIADSENAARAGQYNTDFNNMLTAQGALGNSTAQAIGYSGLLDSKAREANQAQSTMWDRQNNQDYNQIAKYLGLLNGSADATNKPLSLWDILGGVGSTVGSFL